MAVGDTWEWEGDLLNISQCDKLVSHFKFAEVVEHEGERCARIVGEVRNWPQGVSAKCSTELYFSLDRNVPVSSSLRYKSSSRTQVIETRTAWPVRAAGGLRGSSGPQLLLGAAWIVQVSPSRRSSSAASKA